MQLANKKIKSKRIWPSRV